MRIFEKITKKKLSLSLVFAGQPDEGVADLRQSFCSDASEISVEDAITPEPQAGFLCIKV